MLLSSWQFSCLIYSNYVKCDMAYSKVIKSSNLTDTSSDIPQTNISLWTIMNPLKCAFIVSFAYLKPIERIESSTSVSAPFNKRAILKEKEKKIIEAYLFWIQRSFGRQPCIAASHCYAPTRFIGLFIVVSVDFKQCVHVRSDLL